MAFDPATGEVEPDDGCVRCALLKADLINLQNEHIKTLRKLSMVEAELKRQQQESDEMPVARAIFRYWLVRTKRDRKRTKFGDKRQKAVLARLRDGYEPAYICRAIDWVAEHGFINSAGHKFDDLELVCRNEVKVESYYRQAEQRNVPTLITDEWIELFSRALPEDDVA